MVLSGSARSKKSQLKRKGMSEVDAIKYLFDHGFVETIQDLRTRTPSKSEKNNVNNVNVNNVNVNKVKIDMITETVWESCLLRLVNEADKMTPQIVDKIRDFLDMKDKISKPPRALLPPNEADMIGFSG